MIAPSTGSDDSDGASTSSTVDGEAAKADTSTPSGGRSASELREVADALRNRVDLFGKTLAAIATIGTTAVGLTKVPDLFPYQGKHGWVWVILACLGLAAAALAAIGVAARLMKVAGPVLMIDDLQHNDDLSKPERDQVQPVFDAAAKRFGYTSVVALRGRERSLRDAASQTIDKDERARRIALADVVNTEIEQAFARSQLVVIRRRASNAVTDLGAFVLYVVAIFGLILYLLGTDAVSSAPSRVAIADAKACGDARKADATPNELGKTKVCDKKGSDSAAAAAKQPSSAAAKAQAIMKLAAALETCTALVDSGGPLKNKDCDAIRRAIVVMTKRSG
jgi:hypothetical protein